MSDDAIAEVANLINASGQNRSQRKQLVRKLGKVENIMAHVQKHVDNSAYKEYQKAVDSNFIHFFACLGMTMIKKYKWTENPDNDHGQITSLFENVNKTIVDYADKGYSTEDIVKELESITGIDLVPDVH